MQIAFEALKHAFTTAPILAHFDPAVQAHMETDSSDFALGGVLSQKDEHGKLHPVAFHSRKLMPAEMNYEIHDKELLAIVDCFDRWRLYLEGAKHRIEVYSDHQNLSYFTTTKVLNRRQARWAIQLSSFSFIINYRPDRQNEKADILSRLPQHRPEKGGSEDQPITSVLQDKHFSHSEGTMLASSAVSFMLSSARLCSIPVPRWTEEFVSRVKEAAASDPAYQDQRTAPGKNVEEQDGLLYRKNRLWVPTSLQQQVMKSEHDTKIAGGRADPVARVGHRVARVGLRLFSGVFAWTEGFTLLQGLVYALLMFLALFYALARIFLVVECFLELHHLPVQIFETPRWTKYWPHIA